MTSRPCFWRTASALAAHLRSSHSLSCSAAATVSLCAAGSLSSLAIWACGGREWKGVCVCVCQEQGGEAAARVVGQQPHWQP